MSSTPTRFLPPEWAPQSGTLLTWPHSGGYWDPLFPRIDDVFVKIAGSIARFQPVIISCHDHEHQQHVNQLLCAGDVNLNQVKTYCVPSNDVWVRDHGPITIMHANKPMLLDFTFNSWGGKYASSLDNLITRRLHDLGAFAGTAMQSTEFILEGGSIEVDGTGTLLTTANCLTSSTRNAGCSVQQIEDQIKQTLGVERILWLQHGHLVGDDTDSHIDTLARFVNSTTICYSACENTDDEHYTELHLMAAELKNLCDQNGQPYQLIPLPIPKAVIGEMEGIRLPASYANFLIINGAVLVPVYDDPADRVAIDRLQRCFPDREMIAIPSRLLIENFGAVHCATMQLPRGVLS